MKTLISIIIICFLAFLSIINISCKNFLEEKNADESTYKQAPQIQQEIPYQFLGHGKLLFQRESASFTAFYLIDADAGVTRKILDYHDSFGKNPVISNDGNEIAFISDPKDNSQSWHDVFTMDSYGGNIEQITRSYDICDTKYPCWMPGVSVLFFLYSANYNTFNKICSAIADNKTQYIDSIFTGDIIINTTLSVSNEGKILFGDYSNIYYIKKDGTGFTKLITSTPPPGYDVELCSPKWSNDDNEIAYIELLSSISPLSYIMNLVITNNLGENRKLILSDTTKEYVFYNDDLSLCWSPDDKKIAFTKVPHDSSNPNSNELQIYVVDSSGNNLMKVTRLQNTKNYSLSWAK